MSDVKTAAAEFSARVERFTPDEAKRVRSVLDDLLQWSVEHSWGVSFSGRGTKGQVWYCVDGISSPFWALIPRSEDGAKLTLLGSAQFPEDLREEARQVLAQIDNRRPKPDEVPTLGCMKLLWAPHRNTVFELMTRLLNQVRSPEPAAS